MAENQGEQGQGNEPEEIAAEDAVGAQETPDAGQLSREQQIVGEPLDESLERAGEETSMATGRAGEDAEYVEEAPRQKPAIPGMDLEVDIVPEGEEALGDRPRYSEDEDYDESAEGGDADDELPQVIAEASIDLAAGARYR